MKQLVKISCLVAVAAMAAVSCAKTEQDKTTFSHRVYIDVSEPVKTSIVESGSNASFLWSSDDATRFTIKENDVNGTEISLSSNDGYQTMTLGATFETEITSSYTYTAFLAKNKTAGGLPKVPASQTCTGSSFDPDADILIAKPQTFNSVQNSLSMRFMRPVAINKMTLKGLDEGEVISSISISADKKLTGHYTIDNESWSGQSGTSGSAEITLSTDQTVPSNGQVTVYFLTQPVDDATLTVVVTTGNYIYSKSFTRSISFTNENVTAFSVNNFTKIDKADYSGDYVIGNADGSAIANAWNNGNNLPQVSSYLEGDVLYYDPDAVTIANAKVTLDKIVDSASPYYGMYTMVQNGKYLYAAGSGDNKWLKGETEPDVNAYWEISELNGDWSVVASQSSNNNVLRYNATSHLFSCYASGAQSPVKLYASFAPTPVITASNIDITAAAVSSSTDTGATFNTNTSSVSAAAYSDEECTTASTWLSVSVSDKVVSYTADANTGNERVGYIKITAANSDSHSVSKVITVTQAKSNTPQYEKVTSALADWSGEYLLVCENQNLALSAISTTSTKYGIGAAVTISNGKIMSSTTTDSYKLVIAAATGGGSGYTIKLGSNYLYWGSGNSLATNASESDNSRWTITAGATSGNWIITNVKQTTREIWYNTQSPRFACYENKTESTSGYAPVQLYKLSSSSAASVATPTFSVAEGTYNAVQNVTISCSTSGASIYYTTDGTTPSSSSTLYSNAVSISQTTTLKAIAIKGSDASDVASATYTLKVATPTFSPAGGSYTSTQNVSISCTTAGASIYYTTDNSTPTTSSTLYNGAISVSSTTTIKAIAVKSNWSNSDMASATYTFGSSGPSAGDELFSTDFGSSAVALASFTGGTSYNNASTITYTASNATYVKIDTGTAGNMTSANLFIGGKSGGSGLTATIAGIRTYGATSVTVTWAANNANSRVSITESSSAAVTSANSASNSGTFALSGTETTITLVITGTASSNTRVDNVSVIYN